MPQEVWRYYGNRLCDVVFCCGKTKCGHFHEPFIVRFLYQELMQYAAVVWMHTTYGNSARSNRQLRPLDVKERRIRLPLDMEAVASAHVPWHTHAPWKLEARVWVEHMRLIRKTAMLKRGWLSLLPFLPSFFPFSNLVACISFRCTFPVARPQPFCFSLLHNFSFLKPAMLNQFSSCVMKALPPPAISNVFETVYYTWRKRFLR